MWGRDRVRISDEQRRIVIETVHQVFGEAARVGLFGSRTDDAKRGGDIDLLVELPCVEPDQRKKSLTCVAMLQSKLGDQPIDVVVTDPSTLRDAFRREAERTAIWL